MDWTVRATGAPSEIDLAEARRALAVLADPAHGCELRGLHAGGKFGGSVVRKGADLDGLLQGAGMLSGTIYYAINPIRPNAKSATAESVVRRRWLLVDVDPERPADASATDAEKIEASAVADAVVLYLGAQGWPAPVVVDSGNGYHLLYRIDLPPDEPSRLLLKTVLEALGERFDNERAQVDRKVFNASRIAKLPGTWARKGPCSDERPHRPCRLLLAPETPQVVTAEQLGLVVPATATERPLPPVNGVDAFHVRATGEGREAYARRALDLECARVRLARPGERNNALNRAAFSLGQLVAIGLLTRQQVEVELTLAGIAVELGETEIAKTIRSGLVAGLEHPRQIAERNGISPTMPEGMQAESKPGESLTVCAADVPPEPVEWLWEERLPKRFVTVFAGQTGVGKSFVTCDIIARITRGTEAPFGKGLCLEQGGVLILSEDPQKQMLVPRLIESGADLSRVRFFRWEKMLSYELKDVAMLDKACKEVPNLRLVVIDPPTNFLGDIDEHKNSEIRQTVMGIIIWLENQNLSCIFILHVNKQTGKGIEAINRILGSIAWVTTSRIAHTFVRDPEDETRALLACAKTNLGPLPRTLAYRIVKSNALARVEWLEEIDMTANEAMGGSGWKPRRVVAKDWLIERFRERQEWSSEELFSRGKQEGISRDAIFEAKKVLDIPKARRTALENGDIEWHWWVPKDWPPLKGEEVDNPFREQP